jgi:hypothetical protein
MREFRSSDGTRWRVDVRGLGASNAMVVFHHPDPGSSGLNRYNWYLAPHGQARDVTARLTPKGVLASLTDDELALLFRRSMAISSRVPRLVPG